MTTSAGSATQERVGFWHEAWPYSGDDEFVERAAAFVDEGARTGEAVLVVVDADKIEQVRTTVGSDVPGVAYADMHALGHNPARIIPAWRRFLSEHADAPAVRGIGEPIHSGRSPEELVECHVHEALLNRAFGDEARDFWLLCPYDTATLSPEVIDAARHTHPYVANADGRSTRGGYDCTRGVDDVFSMPLSPVPTTAMAYPFAGVELSGVREAASAFAASAGLEPGPVDDFVLGVHEVAANSVRHGPGCGELWLWRRADRLIVEVRDAGHIDDPMAGRVEPHWGDVSGRGLWLTNQLFDLVQIRSNGKGAVVRLHWLVG